MALFPLDLRRTHYGTSPPRQLHDHARCPSSNTSDRKAPTVTRQELADYVYKTYDDKTLGGYTDPVIEEANREKVAAFNKALKDGTLTIQGPREVPGFAEKSHFVHQTFARGSSSSGNIDPGALDNVAREYSLAASSHELGAYIISWGDEKSAATAEKQAKIDTLLSQYYEAQGYPVGPF